MKRVLEYRIVKKTFYDGREIFEVQFKDVERENWLLVTCRDTVEGAREVIEKTKSNFVVSEEVVE